MPLSGTDFGLLSNSFTQRSIFHVQLIQYKWNNILVCILKIWLSIIFLEGKDKYTDPGHDDYNIFPETDVNVVNNS